MIYFTDLCLPHAILLLHSSSRLDLAKFQFVENYLVEILVFRKQVWELCHRCGGGDTGSFGSAVDDENSAIGDEDSSVDDADSADDDEDCAVDDEDSGAGDDDEVGGNVGDDDGELVMIVIARLVLETRSDFLFLTVPVHLQTVKRKRTSENKNFPPKKISPEKQ